jgi:hypothetical protein
MENLIVLTHGWTGSSVFAALAGAAGGWLGDQTKLKPDYDTFENAELVDLNRQMLRELAPRLDHEHAFDQDSVCRIVLRARHADMTPYRDFVDRCSARQPWVWKDPRLTWTMRVWAPLLDLTRVRFLIVTREPLQAWASANLRRHVQSYRFTAAYNGGITRSNLHFVESTGAKHLTLSFEDLLLRPEWTLDRMNELLDAQLSAADLRAVCHLPLGKRSRGAMDIATAALIYLRNYGERDGRGRVVPLAG